MHHINDSTDRFYSDTMTAGDRENDPILVDQLVIFPFPLSISSKIHILEDPYYREQLFLTTQRPLLKLLL